MHYSFVLSVILTIALLFGSGCTESNKVVTPPVTSNFLSSGLGFLTVDQIIARYDTSNIAAIFSVTSDSSNPMILETGQALPIETQTAFSYSFGPDDIPQRDQFAPLSFNTSTIALANTEQTIVFNPLVRFGGSTPNHFLKSSDVFLGSFDTTLHFLPKVSIQNISWGQSISKSQDLTIALGTSGGYVNCLFDVCDSNNVYRGMNYILENTNGSITIPAAELAKLSNGRSHIIIKQSELHFIRSSNGKRICVVGTSTNQIAVVLGN